MGRVARWLRTLLARKKPGVGEPRAEQQEKRRWGFGKSLSEKEQKRAVAGMSAASLAVSKEPNESYREVPRPYGPATLVVDEEQNKRAIAVAAATTAVAEAAVAAVKAVAVVVRLTNSGQALGLAGGQRDELAAIKIQSGFRGYLARRALKALRGLVKLQALVRGNIVRKQAAETLRCMQAMVRVQARARSCRALRTQKSRSELCPRMQFDALTSGKYEQAVQASAAVSDMSCTLKGEIEAVDCNRANASALNWWMQGAIEAVQKSGSFTSIDDDKNAKILEVDPGKPQSNHKKSNHYQYPFSPNLAPDYNSRGDSTIQQSTPTAVSVDMQQYLSSMRFPMEAIYYCQSSQFDSASSRHANARKGLLTPSKSEYSMSLFSEFADYPNYMSNTESSKAKLRSQSAPKRRPELETFGFTKKPSVQGHGQKPTGALAHRSSSLHAQFANKAYPGAGRLDRLGLPSEFDES